MTTAVAAPDHGQLIETLGNSLYPGASKNSIEMVLAYCGAAQLDPMQKPVHIVPMYDRNIKGMRDVVMPGIGLYRTQAARTKQFAGMSEPEFGEEKTFDLGGVKITAPESCRVTVRRALESGHIAEFTAVEYWIENYAQKGGAEKSIAPNAMWSKRPRGQLAKCAEAQALRRAFPEVGAMPTAEEMEGKQFDGNEAIDGTARRVAEQEPTPFATPEQFEKNRAAWQGLIRSGRKTPEQLIDFLGSKYRLTEDQQAVLKSTKKEEEVTNENA